MVDITGILILLYSCCFSLHIRTPLGGAIHEDGNGHFLILSNRI